MAAEPIFKHEGCDRCVYLGPYGDDEASVTHDLWFCDQASRVDTVMARYGDLGWEYHSGLGSSLPPMREAERRARALGLLSPLSDSKGVDDR